MIRRAAPSRAPTESVPALTTDASTLTSTRYFGDASSRLVAYVIDAVLLSVVVFAAAALVSVAIGPLVRFGSGEATLDEGVAIVDALVATVLGALFFAGSWARFGASPGQRLLGMRVVDEAEGSPIGARRALLRWAPIGLPLGAAALLTAVLSGPGDAAVDLALLAWYVALLATTARSATKQGLHDRLARTVVVRTGRPATFRGGPAPGGSDDR